MTSTLPASSLSPTTRLRGFWRLFWLYFSWRSAVLGCAHLGMALLALTVLNWLVPARAFPLALLTCVLLLAVPLLAAPPLMRTLIGHRSISMVPHLPLMAGMALLLLTVLTALFVPAIGMLLGVPGVGIRSGVQVFVVASLYVWTVQRLMISPYAALAFSWLPPMLVMVLAIFGGDILQWFRRPAVLWACGAASIAGWLYALHVLAHRSVFKPVHAAKDTFYTISNTLQGTRLLGVNLTSGASPTGTLLLAYPASLAIRIINIGTFAILTPLLGTGAVALMPYSSPGPKSLFLVNFYLMMTLLSGCVSAFYYGEWGPRARLLWLRSGGDRAQLWRLTERQLWLNLALLVALMLPAVLLATYVNADTQSLHYGVIAVFYAAFEIYRSLCARLYNWPSLVRVVVTLLSVGALFGALISIMGFFYTTDIDTPVLMAVETVVLLLALLWRSLARARFVKVDWMVVKHSISRRAMVGT